MSAEGRRLALENNEREQVVQQRDEENRAEKRKRRKIEKERRRKEALPVITPNEIRFFSEGFVPINSDLTLHPEAKSVRVASRNVSYLSKNISDPLEIFLKLVPFEVWDHIASETSKRMRDVALSGEVTKETGRKYFKRHLTPQELFKAFFMREFLNFQRGTLREAFQEQKDGGEPFPIEQGRYGAIMTSLTCDFDTLRTLLASHWSACINPGDEFAVDESLFAFYSKDPLSPQRYFPRKPHKNGLVIYTAAFKMRNGVTYVFDFVPDVIAGNPVKSRHALQVMIDRFPWDWTNIHITIDAGFSGEQCFGILRDKQVFYTASVNQKHKLWLYDLLTTYCPTNGWIGAFDCNGCLWSVKHSVENKKKGFMFLTSNAFSTHEALLPFNSEVLIGETELKLLSKLGRRVLVRMAEEMEIPLDENPDFPERAIATRLNSSKPFPKPPSLAKQKQKIVSSDSDEESGQEYPQQGSDPDVEIPLQRYPAQPEGCDPKLLARKSPTPAPSTHIFFDSDGEVEDSFCPEENEDPVLKAPNLQRDAKSKGKEKEVTETQSTDSGEGDLESQEEDLEIGEQFDQEEGEGEEEMTEGDQGRQFLEEELRRMKVGELKEIIKRKGLAVGKKEQMIHGILVAQELDQAAIRERIEKLKKGGKMTKPIHHEYYRDHFNSVDIHDGYWYSLQGNHRIVKWQAKFVVSLLEIAIINAFALGKRHGKETVAKFRDDMANRALSPSFHLENK